MKVLFLPFWHLNGTFYFTNLGLEIADKTLLGGGLVSCSRTDGHLRLLVAFAGLLAFVFLQEADGSVTQNTKGGSNSEADPNLLERGGLSRGPRWSRL